MGLAEKRTHDAAMASYMKDRPGSYPDSVRRPHQGQGAGDRKTAMSMGRVPSDGHHFEIGMLGGILAAKLGYSDFGVKDFLNA